MRSIIFSLILLLSISAAGQNTLVRDGKNTLTNRLAVGLGFRPPQATTIPAEPQLLDLKGHQASGALLYTSVGDSGLLYWNRNRWLRIIDEKTAGNGGGGITEIGTMAEIGDPKGASINGTTLIMHPATATTPGLLSNDPQRITGPKTFEDVVTLRTATGGGLNVGSPSLFLRDGGAAGRIGIGKELTSMHLFVPTDFSSFRFYGGGDFNSSASDWMTLNSSSLSLGTGVSLTLNEVLRTRQSGGGNVNAGTAAIYLRDGGAGQRIGLGKQLTSMHFFVPTDFSSYRWYAGGDFNSGATNWMNLDANALQVHSSLRLSGAGGYGSINEYTNNQLYIGGSRLDIGTAIFFNGPGWARGRGEMTANGQVVFSDINGNNGVVASSVFTTVSNSRGSMPFPLMTEAQRLAIASPAVGLHVYQTDGTEGLYVRKSTGWVLAY